ncbi:MAG TPA: hypothetical protein VNM47_18260 [Terriglobia bacterium]|nr:hypothetical protein [Terriglobia bacterium]
MSRRKQAAMGTLISLGFTQSLIEGVTEGGVLFVVVFYRKFAVAIDQSASRIQMIACIQWIAIVVGYPVKKFIGPVNDKIVLMFFPFCFGHRTGS